MKVLIVDDEPLIRRSLEMVFQRSGHETLLGNDGDQGIQLWREWQPDIVVIDVLMPGPSGPEVIREVRPETRTGIILVSAYTGEYTVESARELGADLFIAKPFDDIRNIVKVAEDLFSAKTSSVEI